MSVTKRDADQFIEQFEKDRDVFVAALDAVQRRKLEVEGTTHEELFTKSSGVVALAHLLIMNLAQTDGILDNLRNQRDELPDAPALRLVGE